VSQFNLAKPLRCGLIALWLAGLCACAVPVATPTRADPRFIPFESVTQEIVFASADGTRLAGQFDAPPTLTSAPLTFIIHHADAVDRDIYQYLAARLVPAGYAVFRFDKRGTGKSDGQYGCCEDEDVLAAYRAVVARRAEARLFIIAQSIGTDILAQRWQTFTQIRAPDGIILLSSRLEGERVTVLDAPLAIVVSDSEPALTAICADAVAAHRARYPAYAATCEVIPQSEHTLFDVSMGPIDWTDPNWTRRFHPAAWRAIRTSLERFSR